MSYTSEIYASLTEEGVKNVSFMDACKNYGQKRNLLTLNKILLYEIVYYEYFIIVVIQLLIYYLIVFFRILESYYLNYIMYYVKELEF